MSDLLSSLIERERMCVFVCLWVVDGAKFAFGTMYSTNVVKKKL